MGGIVAGLLAARRPGKLVARWSALPLVLLTGLAAISPLVSFFTAPIDFDEGYNLQVPAHLATTGAYSTDGSAYEGTPVPFDTRITTGPTLLVPVAGLFTVFGQDIWVARVVPLVGYLVLVYASWCVGRHLDGSRGGYAALLAVALVDDSAIGGGATVLGEVTATALVLSAALQLATKTRLAGFLIGLAVLTKILAALSLPGFLLAVALSHASLGLRVVGTRLTLFVGWAALPIAAWQLIRVVALGPDLYWSRNQEFMSFLGSHGSGAALGRDGDVLERLRMLFTAWPSVLLVLGVILLIVVAVSSQRVVLFGAGRSEWLSRLADRGGDSSFTVVAALASTAGVWLAWWLFVSDRMWLRHVLPAVYIGTAIAAAWLLRHVRSHGCAVPAARTVLQSLAAALVVGFLLVEPAQDWAAANRPGTTTLGQQRHVATLVNQLGVRNTLHVAWHRNPEVGFLAGVPSLPLGDHTGLLVLSPTHKRLELPGYEAAATACREEVYEGGGYLVCWV